MNGREAIKAEADAILERIKQARSAVEAGIADMVALRARCLHPAAARPFPNDYITKCPDCGHVFYDTAKSTKAD